MSKEDSFFMMDEWLMLRKMHTRDERRWRRDVPLSTYGRSCDREKSPWTISTIKRTQKSASKIIISLLCTPKIIAEIGAAASLLALKSPILHREKWAREKCVLGQLMDTMLCNYDHDDDSIFALFKGLHRHNSKIHFSCLTKKVKNTNMAL